MWKQWKKVMAGTLSVCLLATCVPGVSELGKFAQTSDVVEAATKKKSGKCGKKATWKYNTKTKTLTISGTGAMEDYSNPNRSEDVNKTKYPGWKNISGIKKVVIGDEITKIGAYTFLKAGIKNVKIGKKVKTIGKGAFENCLSLTKVECGNKVEKISNYAFFNCKGLKKFILGKKVKTIGHYAFSNCDALKEVKSGKNVQTIGEEAFFSCSVLEKAELGKKVKTIKYNAFEGCKKLEEVDFGDNVEDILDEAFSGCEKLKKVKIGKNIKTIGEFAFSGCYELEDIDIGDKLQSIGDNAFENCYNLTKFYIGKAVKKIGASVFLCSDKLNTINVHTENKYFIKNENMLLDKNKTKLYWVDCSTNTTCYLDSSVTHLDETIINNEKLEAFEVSSENKNYYAEEGLLYTKDGIRLLQCPKGKKGTVVISDKAVRMDETVEFFEFGFGKNSFEDCSKIEKIIVGKNIESMDAKFSGCTNLKEVEVDAENKYYVSENGSILSKDKTKLVGYIVVEEDGTYTVPDSVTVIETNVFLPEGREKPTRIVLSDGVKEFGQIPATVTSILLGKEYESGYEFFNNTGMSVKEITVSEENQNFKTKDGVLYTKDGSKLLLCPPKKEGTVTIDSETTTIVEGAFFEATNITTIYLSETLTNIEENAFTSANKKLVFVVPKGKMEFYKKLLTSKTGFKSTMTIKEAE